MKCGYSKCKLGGEVDKEVAIKVGKRWWHEECIKERDLKSEIEKTYYEKFESKEPIINVRNAISKYIDKDMHDPNYVLWCLKNKATKLNSLFGLSYILGYKQNEIDFKKEQARKINLEFGKYSDDRFEKIEQAIPKKNKTWSDYFGGKNE